MNHYTPHSEIKFCILLFVSVKIFSYSFDLFWLYACFFLVYTLKYEGLCLIYVICVCLRLVAPNSYCVVSLFCLSSSCVLCYLWDSSCSIFSLGFCVVICRSLFIFLFFFILTIELSFLLPPMASDYPFDILDEPGVFYCFSRKTVCKFNH